MGSIDTAAILDRTNLRQLIESTGRHFDRTNKTVCPFHDDHTPSLSLDREGRRFKCWTDGCGMAGSAIDFVMAYDRVDFLEACKKLDPCGYANRDGAAWKPSVPPPVVPKPSPAPAPEVWRDPGYQAEVDRIVCEAEVILYSPAGKEALGWLEDRGVDPDVARRFRLGYLPTDRWSRKLAILAKPDGKPGCIWARRGVVIPWLAPGAWFSATEPTPGPRWCGANVRCLGPDDDLGGERVDGAPKYQAFSRSERGHGYPFPELEDSQFGPPALLLEGEFDAILAQSLVGHLVHPFSVGGSTQVEIKPATLASLAACPWWLIASDCDESGESAADRWRDMAPHKARTLLVPFGKDITESHQAGEDLAAWMAEELVDLGIDHRAAEFDPALPVDWSRFTAADLGDPQTGMGDAYESDLPETLSRLIERRSAP